MTYIIPPVTRRIANAGPKLNAVHRICRRICALILLGASITVAMAAATARALRVEAAAELRDPRPPAATMKATDAQILLEASSATLSSKAASRLRLAVALNGYISANESPATIAAAAAPPQLNTLFKHILEPAAAAIAAKWPPPTTDRDDISPYRPFMVIRA